MNVDFLITEFDKGLRTLFARAHSARPHPDANVPESAFTEDERRHAAALMRVNHAGEVCAQALYQGQAITARKTAVQQTLTQAAQEETEHLAWTEQRIHELAGRKSLLNPLWYTGSLTIGMLAGLVGDRWNLGFLAATEQQVEQHLERHLQRLPAQDTKSRAILQQMKTDEMRHATTALNQGGSELPGPIKTVMHLVSRAMTETSYWV